MYEMNNVIVASILAAFYFGNLRMILIKPKMNFIFQVEKSRILLNHHFKWACPLQSGVGFPKRCSRFFLIYSQDVEIFANMTESIIEALDGWRLATKFMNKFCGWRAVHDRLHGSNVQTAMRGAKEYGSLQYWRHSRWKGMISIHKILVKTQLLFILGLLTRMVYWVRSHAYQCIFDYQATQAVANQDNRSKFTLRLTLHGMKLDDKVAAQIGKDMF